jgi:hypothetical protein
MFKYIKLKKLGLKVVECSASVGNLWVSKVYLGRKAFTINFKVSYTI